MPSRVSLSFTRNMRAELLIWTKALPVASICLKKAGSLATLDFFIRSTFSSTIFRPEKNGISFFCFGLSLAAVALFMMKAVDFSMSVSSAEAFFELFFGADFLPLSAFADLVDFALAGVAAA